MRLRAGAYAEDLTVSNGSNYGLREVTGFAFLWIEDDLLTRTAEENVGTVENIPP